jgi:hypothetical protein
MVFVSVIPSARAALLSGAPFGQVLNTVGIAAVLARARIHLHSTIAKLQACMYFFYHSHLHALPSHYFISLFFLICHSANLALSLVNFMPSCNGQLYVHFFQMVLICFVDLCIIF